jgi:hypothetical protein
MTRFDGIKSPEATDILTFYFHRHPIGVLAKAQKKVVGMAL